MCWNGTLSIIFIPFNTSALLVGMRIHPPPRPRMPEGGPTWMTLPLGGASPKCTLHRYVDVDGDFDFQDGKWLVWKIWKQSKTMDAYHLQIPRLLMMLKLRFPTKYGDSSYHCASLGVSITLYSSFHAAIYTPFGMNNKSPLLQLSLS